MRPNVLVVLALAVAGCLGAPAATETTGSILPPPVEEYVPVQDHDHADPAEHRAIHGFEVLGWHNGYADDGTWPHGGTVNELAVVGGFAYLARSGPEGGFVVLDVADPARITKVGEFDAEGTADVDTSYDGRWVFSSTQRTIPDLGHTAAEPPHHTPRGLYVVDALDKSNPRLESFFPLPPNGPHTATYAEIEGKPYVFLQTYDLLAVPGGGLLGALPVTQKVVVTEFVVEGGKHVLRPVSTFTVVEPQNGPDVFPHDATVQRHPDGRWILTIAYWNAGLKLVDVSDPRDPREISTFDDFHPSALKNMHDAKAFDVLIGGRHVTVTGPEIPTADEDGQLTFVDTTDPAAPQWLGYWSLPGDHVVDVPFLFSPHVFDLTDEGVVYIGHNHGGVWGIDASDPTEPRTVGWFMADRVRDGWTGPMPATWGVRWPGDGLLYVSDVPTGLYVLRPAHAAPASSDVAPFA